MDFWPDRVLSTEGDGGGKLPPQKSFPEKKFKPISNFDGDFKESVKITNV